MAYGPAPDKRLGYLIHLDGRHYAREHILLFQRILPRERVDNSRQHAHVIGRDAVHLFCLLCYAAEKITAAYHDSNLNFERVHIGQFSRDFVNTQRIYAEALGCGQGFAGEFEQNAFKDRSRHYETLEPTSAAKAGCCRITLPPRRHPCSAWWRRWLPPPRQL